MLKFRITEQCVHCGACAMDCPVQAIVDYGSCYCIDSQCISCGDCYTICPVGAIEMINEENQK